MQVIEIFPVPAVQAGKHFKAVLNKAGRQQVATKWTSDFTTKHAKGHEENKKASTGDRFPVCRTAVTCVRKELAAVKKRKACTGLRPNNGFIRCSER